MARKEFRDALVAVLAGTGDPPHVRDEIVASWQRVASAGLLPDRFDPPYDPALDQDGRLERAARPVMDRLADDLAGTATSLLLTDERAHIVERRVADTDLRARLDHILLAPGFYYGESGVGTNGIGSALAEHGPAFVRGGEHYADALTEMACAGAPVTDPRTGQVLGVIDITCDLTNANPLMLPLAKRAAWEIEQRLLASAPTIQHVLHERFQDARRSAKGPLALVGEGVLMTNPAAARIVQPSDQDRLWEHACTMIADGGGRREDRVSEGAVITGCEAVLEDGLLVGVVVRLQSTASRGNGETNGHPSDRPAIGWSSLTEAERGVGDLVAEGLTNREVAARLFVSPHTVDAHLRHIFHKLGIRSRVELARMVAEHDEPAQAGGNIDR